MKHIEFRFRIAGSDKPGGEWVCLDKNDNPMGRIYLSDDNYYFRPGNDAGGGVVNFSSQQLLEIALFMNSLLAIPDIYRGEA